jgi:hypothetical protein
MAKKFTDANFNEGISAREAYIHSLYHTSIAAALNNRFADEVATSVRDFADALYPQESSDAR